MTEIQIEDLLENCKKGFSSLSVGENFKTKALEFLQRWLSEKVFKEYNPKLNT